MSRFDKMINSQNKCYMWKFFQTSSLLTSCITGWQLGWNHHGGHRNIRPQLVSGGPGWLRKRDWRSGRETELCTLSSFGPNPSPGPAGPCHTPGLPGAATARVARASAGLRHRLRGPVSLAGFQTSHSAAGRLGVVCATGASLPAQDSSVSRSSWSAHTPPAALLLALLWSAHFRLTGMCVCVGTSDTSKLYVELSLCEINYSNKLIFFWLNTVCSTGRELPGHSAVCSVVGRRFAVHPLPGGCSPGDPTSTALLFFVCREIHWWRDSPLQPGTTQVQFL